MTQNLCFGTLAVGQRYRTHAKILAQDIQKYAPTIPFVVLTDQPEDFSNDPNVIVFKHQLQSVKGFHDKRFVFEKAFEQFESCLFLDSDMRILEPVPEHLEWLPGLTARHGCSILRHNAEKKIRKALPVIKKAAQVLAINLDNTIWFHEFMFVVKKQDGVEQTFLNYWKTIAYFFEIHGIYDGSGNVMGLAAAKAGLTTQFDREDKFLFFKDNVEKERMKLGQSKLKENQHYFELHRQVEFPDRSLLKKAVMKVRKKVVFFYRLQRLRAIARRDADLARLL